MLTTAHHAASSRYHEILSTHRGVPPINEIKGTLNLLRGEQYIWLLKRSTKQGYLAWIILDHFIVFIFVFVFDTRFHITQTGLKFTMYPRLTLNS